MTTTTITALPGGHAGALGGTERIPLDQAGTTKYTTPADLATYIGASPLEVTDGTTTVTAVTEINITSGATVSSGGAGIADVAISGGGGGGGGGGGMDVLKLEAKAYVVVTNPNAGGTSLALSHATNVSGITITARGRYQVTFSSAIPSGCILMGSGRFADDASSEAVVDIGLDRHSGLGMGTTTCDMTVVGAGQSALLDGNFDPLWFYFEIRDPATTVAMAAVAGASTVSGLPASPAQGDRAFVTDATATTFLSTVAGGGSDKVPVVYDGTNWVIG